MSELDLDSTRLLALARAARTPTEIDRARVAKRLGLTAGVAAAAAAQVGGVPGSAAAMSGSASGAAASSGTGTAVPGTAVTGQGAAALKAVGAGAGWGPIKLGLAGALLVSAATATYLVRSRSSTEVPSVETSRLQSTGAPHAARPLEPAPLQPSAAEATPDSAPRPRSAEDPTPRPYRTAQRATDANTLAAELDLLHRAQSAWREHQPDRASELLSSHRRSYPASALRAEREALQILVLCETGEVKQAARLARALLKRAPNSPARAAIEQSCAAIGSSPARTR